MTKLDNAYPDPWQLVAELRAENERLRAALEDVEWVQDPELEEYSYCPWCLEKSEHATDCQRQIALGKEQL